MNANAKLWVEALRNPKYPQARHTLTIIDNKGAISGECCLGVACRIAMENGVLLQIENHETRQIIDGQENYLPKKVQNWLGLATNQGILETDTGVSLAFRNDHGDSFAQIADIIESEPPGLFLP